MKTLLIVLAAILVIAVVLVGAAFLESERQFNITLRDQNGLAREDIREPEVKASKGSLVGARAIPHKYVLTRKAYYIDVLINPKDFGHPAILQFRARALDGAELQMTANWSGPCGKIGPTTEFRFWQMLFVKLSDSVGFMWAPQIFCSGLYTTVQEEEDVARDASSHPISLLIQKQDGGVLGRETIEFEIEPNGYVLYGVIP